MIKNGPIRLQDDYTFKHSTGYGIAIYSKLLLFSYRNSMQYSTRIRWALTSYVKQHIEKTKCSLTSGFFEGPVPFQYSESISKSCHEASLLDGGKLRGTLDSELFQSSMSC